MKTNFNAKSSTRSVYRLYRSNANEFAGEIIETETAIMITFTTTVGIIAILIGLLLPAVQK